MRMSVSAIMVYLRGYVSSRPRGFHLVSFPKNEINEMKKKIKRKKNYMKN